MRSSAFAGRSDTVKLLLDRGADLGRLNHDGKTAVHRALDEGHYDVITTMISAGAKFPSSLANMMLNGNPSQISSTFYFLSKKLDKFVEKYNEVCSMLCRVISLIFDHQRRS